MLDDSYKLLDKELLPALEENGVNFTTIEEISATQQQALQQRFSDQIYPLLTPLGCVEDEPLPVLPAMQLIIALSLANEKGEARTVYLPVPESLDRFVRIVVDKNAEDVILLEDLIVSHVGELFPDETVAQHTCFRITRNGDIVLHEEDVIDLAGEMEEVLNERKTSNAVRLEILTEVPDELLKDIQHVSGALDEQTYHMDGMLRLSDLFGILGAGSSNLRDPNWEPQASPRLHPEVSMFDCIAEQDVLLHHPYESFEPVMRLLEEAAVDPQTLSIKQVLYRTAKDSRVIDALIKAAENGKQVTVLVELKARFDEARNLQRADELQRAGVQIVYGVKNLKTHAKILLIVRNENGKLRRYMHLGTGNYNESTAKLYTDISYLTARNAYGADASVFFNAITGRSQITSMRRLVPAPTQMKRTLLEKIQSEVRRAKEGEKARIVAKINSLQDKEMIDALYDASRAGVKIQLNIRGICCLKTEDKKYSENIEVVSVIDRYLEHARIFYFHQGGEPDLYIASADWMTRNLEKRVELMIPIQDKEAKRRLTGILEAPFKDNVQAHIIKGDGSSERKKSSKKDAFRMQKFFQQQAEKAAKAKSLQQSTTFEPHVPSEE
eukprot:Seg16698.1 transcript_id=Seg16698.1/GoldUCD/mRNA.D3Y31 product="Polyphosphate kinase" protein_id=Seg16698.1/GoldUCD/D3Y31